MERKYSNLEKDAPKLREAGVEIFDIFTMKELKFFTDKKYHSGDQAPHLAGHLQTEHQIGNPPDYFEKKILNAIPESPIIVNELTRRFPVNTLFCPIKLMSCWVNYQKKYEFNPLHKHDGVLSFIIFLKIPYKLEDEEKIYRGNAKNASKLQFVITDIMGEINCVTANVDESYLGKMLVFNARKYHTVYPFYTSDECRITASGNFGYDVENFNKKYKRKTREGLIKKFK